MTQPLPPCETGAIGGAVRVRLRAVLAAVCHHAALHAAAAARGLSLPAPAPLVLRPWPAHCGPCPRQGQKGPPPPPQSCSFNPASTFGDDPARLVRLEVYLPVLLWVCCALGYGHLVAASNDGSKRGQPLPAFAGKRDENGAAVGGEGGLREKEQKVRRGARAIETQNG